MGATRVPQIGSFVIKNVKRENMTQRSNSKRSFIILALIIIAAIVAYFLFDKKSTQGDPLRLGWQPPWVNQGQIVEVFKHSDVLKKNGVQLNYVPFTYGGPMTEAALAGSLDIVFAGDQPGITLITKDPKWKIVARMINYRSAIVVPKNAPFNVLEELKGKKIATAFGSTTHRDLIRELRASGIDPEKDVQLINLDQAEHASVISSGGVDSWKGVDAIATYDPTVAIAVFKSNAKIIKEWLSPAVVVVKEDVLKNREKDIVQFLKAYREAFTIYAARPAEYNRFYSEESRLELPDSVYSEMAKFEPNMSAKDINDVDIIINEEREKLHQTNADIALSIGIIKKKLIIKDVVTNSYAEKVKIQ